MKILAASRVISMAPVTLVAKTASNFCELHFHQRLEDAAAGVVHQNVEVAELFENFRVGALNIRFLGDVGLDGMRAQGARGFGQRPYRGR